MRNGGPVQPQLCRRRYLSRSGNCLRIGSRSLLFLPTGALWCFQQLPGSVGQVVYGGAGLGFVGLQPDDVFYATIPPFEKARHALFHMLTATPEEAESRGCRNVRNSQFQYFLETPRGQVLLTTHRGKPSGSGVVLVPVRIDHYYFELGLQQSKQVRVLS